MKILILSLTLAGLAGCASKTTPPPPEAAEPAATSTAEKAPAAESDSNPSSGLQIRLIPQNAKSKANQKDKASDPAENTAGRPPAVGEPEPSESLADVEVKASSSPDAEKFSGTEPMVSLRYLKNGNQRFVKGHLRSDGQSMRDVTRVAASQRPHTVILSCSDSRVPPEIVFDQKLGEVYVVRNAGQSLDPSTIGSIEHAVDRLGARLILVMGHTSCDTLKSAIETLNGGDAGSPSLNHLVADIHPRIRSHVDRRPSSDLHVESWANAKGVAADLVQRSQLIAQALRTGKVRIISSLYDTSTGKVDFE